MLSRLTGQTIALIVIGLSLLVAVLWYFTMYTNTLSESETIRGEISTLNDQKQIGERARANVVQLCQVVADLQKQKAEFLQALPSNEQFSSLLNTLTTQARATSGAINSIGRSLNAAPAGAPAGVKSINLTISFEGILDSIRGLLASLEGQQRFLRVDTLSLAPKDQLATNPKLTSQMTMLAYIYDGAGRNTTETPLNPVCADNGTGVPR